MVNFKRLRFAFWAAVFCASVMLFEDVGEAMGVKWIEEWDDLHVWEFLIVGFLLLAILLVGVEAYRLKKQNDSLEEKVARASGAFQELLNGYFDNWDFSPAERDVARLILKGCSIAEIADIRGAKEGTVKAQTNAIYKKSGYANKTQLLSAFIEDLTDGGSVEDGQRAA